MLGDLDGDEGFAAIKKERGDAEALGSGARDVGGADVAAAGGADVLMAEDFDEEIAEGDRTQKIGERNGDEPGVHGCLDEFSKTAGWRVSWLASKRLVHLFLRLLLEQVVADEVEGVLAGPPTYAVAVAEEIELFYLRVLCIGECDVDEADGLFGVWAGSAWAGARDASD